MTWFVFKTSENQVSFFFFCLHCTGAQPNTLLKHLEVFTVINIVREVSNSKFCEACRRPVRPQPWTLPRDKILHGFLKFEMEKCLVYDRKRRNQTRPVGKSFVGEHDVSRNSLEFTVKHFQRGAQGTRANCRHEDGRAPGVPFRSSASSACRRTWGEWCRRRCHLRSPVGRWISSSLDPSARPAPSWPGPELPSCIWCNERDDQRRLYTTRLIISSANN